LATRQACLDQAFDVFRPHMHSPPASETVSLLRSAADLIAPMQHYQTDTRYYSERTDRHTQTEPGRDVRYSEKPVTEAVNHIEKWVETGNFLPKTGKGVDGIKHPAEKGQGQDDEILEGR